MNSPLKSKSQIGFTLIEILVVFSVLVILTTSGVIAFLSYGRVQAVNAATGNVASFLFTARSRALSQVKPNAGTCRTVPPAESPKLNGYKVILCPSGCAGSDFIYQLVAVCDDKENIIQSTQLTANIKFSNVNKQIFFYEILSGKVTENASVDGTAINIYYSSNVNLKREIKVYSDGRIGVN